jgi:hypothetical protein
LIPNTLMVAEGWVSHFPPGHLFAMAALIPHAARSDIRGRAHGPRRPLLAEVAAGESRPGPRCCPTGGCGPLHGLARRRFDESRLGRRVRGGRAVCGASGQGRSCLVGRRGRCRRWAHGLGPSPDRPGPGGRVHTGSMGPGRIWSRRTRSCVVPASRRGHPVGRSAFRCVPRLVQSAPVRRPLHPGLPSPLSEIVIA